VLRKPLPDVIAFTDVGKLPAELAHTAQEGNALHVF
jgi:hypothetical protein